MLSKKSSKPDVRVSFENYLKIQKHPFDAICLAESSSNNVDIKELLPDYQIYESKISDTYLYKHGYKFAIAYKEGCTVQPINYPTDYFLDQAFINSIENEGYCKEQMFNINLGKYNVVVVHIQSINTRKEMKTLSQFSQCAGLSGLFSHMKANESDVVIGDFNVCLNVLQNKIEDSDLNKGDSGYLLVDLNQDINGGKIHHAIRKKRECTHILH